jgi:hypothetical protein
MQSNNQLQQHGHGPSPGGQLRHGGGGGGQWRHGSAGFWRNGGWIAPGLAFGFLSAAAAVTAYGAPPELGMCWYFDDPYRQSGHRDYC